MGQRETDYRKWAGEAETQKAEAGKYIIGIVIVLIVGVPLAVWVGEILSTAMGL